MVVEDLKPYEALEIGLGVFLLGLVCSDEMLMFIGARLAGTALLRMEVTQVTR